MSRYKFRVFSFHSNQVEYPYEEDYGVYLDGADGYVPMESTGSLDKGGDIIWENDIVLWDNEDPFDCSPAKTKKVVGWNQRCMQFRLYDFPNEIGEKSGEPFLAEDVQVIGNIFDYQNEECRYHLDESVKSLVEPLEIIE